MDVAYEAREAQQPQQAEDLHEAHDAERTRRLVEVRVDARLHDQEDVVHGDGGDEVHGKPVRHHQRVLIQQFIWAGSDRENIEEGYLGQSSDAAGFDGVV